MRFLNKIQKLEKGSTQTKKWKDDGLEVVFTNGCFDIIHLGHVTYLERARAMGSKLIVGLNSDASVNRLKGEGRPIKDIENRAAVLAALECIDMVIVFEQDTPVQLIESLVPDILVKGGDYKIEDIIGADFVIENGGKVETIEFVDGHSSSDLISKMTSK